MTDMNEMEKMPERVFIRTDSDGIRRIKGFGKLETKFNPTIDTEYIRRDLHLSELREIRRQVEERVAQLKSPLTRNSENNKFTTGFLAGIGNLEWVLDLLPKEQ